MKMQRKNVNLISLKNTYKSKLVPYSQSVYLLSQNNLDISCIGIFWFLADLLNYQLKTRLEYTTYKKLYHSSEHIEFNINSTQIFNSANVLTVSLNSIADALQYQVSTRTRKKVYELIEIIQRTPIQTYLIDPKTGILTRKSKSLIFSVSQVINQKRQVCAKIEFNTILFSKVFLNPVLYEPGIVKHFSIYLKQKLNTKIIPKIAVSCLLTLVESKKQQEKQIQLFTQACLSNKKRDKLRYVNIVFHCLQFLIDKNIITSWSLITDNIYQQFQEIEAFIENINFRTKKQKLLLDSLFYLFTREI
jgi:hypothetical protein